ncbi:MAG: hypothetical protein QXN71_03895 [Candidatus Aenigmatarchaeota archaeon]
MESSGGSPDKAKNKSPIPFFHLSMANIRILPAFFTFLLLIAFLPLSRAAPTSYITEEVNAGYFYNGSLSGPITTSGYIEVDVQNTHDVLQYIRLTLSGTSGTNLMSNVAYRNVAASPNNPGDRTLIFVNTTANPESLSYEITNQSITPIIGMRMDYFNQIGGREIVPGANTFTFTLTLNSTHNLPSTNLVIQGRRNTFGTNDSVNFTSASIPSGSFQLVDTDSDGFNDRFSWTGNLPQGEFNLSFTGMISPGINFDENLMYVNLDESQSHCSHSGSGTFTGITFSDRFSRGPIREGIEMLGTGTWTVRGFIKNTASDITYILHGWELYEIGSPDPVLSSSQSSYILPGETKYTGWYDTGISGKPAYYSGSFDWEVVWGTSVYTGISRSTMTMPVIYEMESWADGTASIVSNTVGGSLIRINITTRHIGHSSIPVNSFIVNSTLPRFSSDGSPVVWTPSSVYVYYSNGSGVYDITNYSTIQTLDSSSGNGFVFAKVNDIFSAIGRYMGQNDDIILSFVVSSPASGSNRNYNFYANTTLHTLSGTPANKTAIISITLPGVEIPVQPGGGGGGGGGPPPSPYAAIVKESSDAYFVTPSIVNVVVVAGIVDSGDKGIKDVKILAYAPEGAGIDTTSFYLRVYHNSTKTWEELVLGKDFVFVDNGLTKVGKDTYREYLLKRKTPEGSVFERTIDLKGGDKIEVSYKEKVPFGTSYLLTRIFGYNYYLDRLVFEDAYIPVRRETEKIESLQIEESEWVQGDAVVGKPVKWIKTFRIFNPNNVSVEEVVATKVFQDSLTVEIREAGSEERTKLQIRGGNETLVNWYARLNALGRKTYFLEATTPPVLETKRDIDIIDSNRTNIRIVINVTLENFAREAYNNMTFDLLIKWESIIRISDPELIIRESENGIRITISRMTGLQLKNISIMYEEKPPIMLATLDALRYGCNDYANLTIFVVPSESDTGGYIEAEVVGPEPEMVTAHAEIVDLSSAKPYEEKRIPIRIALASFPSGKYLVYLKYKKDFGTILSENREFFVECPNEVIHISWVLIVGISLVITSLLAIRVHRKKSYEKEIEELRKKVKGI